MSHHLLRAAGRLGFLYGLVYVPTYFFLRWYRSDAIGLDIGFTAGWVALPTFSPQQWASQNRDWAYTYFRWGAVFAVVGVACALATRRC